MAKVFFDTNHFIHFNEISNISLADLFNQNHLYLSTLTCHIFCYLSKVKVPKEEVTENFKLFSFVNLTRQIMYKALEGPTSDFEDNVQLHSAAEAECDYFLTSDINLLKMKFFGKTKISDKIN